MQSHLSTQTAWLRSYYLGRAIFSVAWVAAAVLFSGQAGPAAVLFVIYPAWDGIANLADARVNGGLKANPSQALNVAVSAITTLAVIVALSHSSYAVLAVFGGWAILAGVLQLYTGVRRWRHYGAQWAMILSGGQSALAGGYMISQSVGTVAPTILDVAPYAGFGAFYFLLSAIWLVATGYRHARA
ncbi:MULTISPECIES: DUF308 domain-containing protein [Bradyrhizobium]|jgi:uncharacterized membrane protein HdeD (DUF308 family)|uniref:DUF308 domain-containing protein n=1 Tax=Bradyrhizobium TaxID=374 RepID=UPI00047F7050|nr:MULTISPECIES: DUF308 domain-containing protein [Bradyrhizobium]MCS3451664.1 uncharacterized membrane protein HdeD (DUF308 family) [Bradyrhizobium elkanii]MCS3566237.1 uncharacterized membrane protein HdeD (DUF308 family) [Bradyrhizobium elkanii]MCW2153033.1 uncharacterized membrane protein HdeD (DUF308 family) [Bradyrhizobium elkanii]MCW2357228.1 uncharacterized membrane protein HdeD (DUF308 family) [Bradyrhizobium elkanii]MCW2376766.1 uncharacterized membrane protein HdeD (DUF308 family) [